LDVDRLSIYKGYSIFLSHPERWINDFSNLYNVLEFLSEFFPLIYEKYESYSKEKFKKKTEVAEGIQKLILQLVKLTDQHSLDYLLGTASNLANDTVLKYHGIISGGEETDFIKLDEDVLKYFILECLKLRRASTFEVRLTLILELAYDLRLHIGDIAKQSHVFVTNLESNYNRLNVDIEGEKCYSSVLDEIYSNLNLISNSVSLEEEKS
jgi:hypothetical protein